jgi:hypothetical protein
MCTLLLHFDLRKCTFARVCHSVKAQSTAADAKQDVKALAPCILCDDVDWALKAACQNVMFEAEKRFRELVHTAIGRVYIAEGRLRPEIVEKLPQGISISAFIVHYRFHMRLGGYYDSMLHAVAQKSPAPFPRRVTFEQLHRVADDSLPYTFTKSQAQPVPFTPVTFDRGMADIPKPTPSFISAYQQRLFGTKK